jgi:hypothetical protein
LRMLPRGAAIEALASTLAALPGRACSLAETQDAAHRLIALLPPPPSTKTRLGRPMRFVRGALALFLRR